MASASYISKRKVINKHNLQLRDGISLTCKSNSRHGKFRKRVKSASAFIISRPWEAYLRTAPHTMRHSREEQTKRQNYTFLDTLWRSRPVDTTHTHLALKHPTLPPTSIHQTAKPAYLGHWLLELIWLLPLLLLNLSSRGEHGEETRRTTTNKPKELKERE